RTLTDMQRTHLVDTVVQAGDRCASMCVPIYLQGDVRAASHYSQFMFHEVRLADPIDGKPQPIDPREQSVITDGFVARFLDRRGVSKQWLARTREKMRGRDYWTTGERLMAEKSGIVTDLI
ncbi:MAG: peptidase, partial [Pseudomonadota bacterium]